MCIRTFEEMEADTRPKRILDLREKEDFEKETYPEAEHLYWGDFTPEKAELKKGEPVYLLCYVGETSEEIAQDLREEGYEIYSLEGGFREYLRRKVRRMMEEAELKARKERTREIERSIIKKFRKEIWRKFTRAINEYELIQDGDRIAVCISGGKDSMLMAKLFQELSRHGKHNFTCEYIVMNPGYNEANYQQILKNAQILDVPVHVFESEIFNIVFEEEKNPCYLCARMRRGYLYSKAKELGCNKIALGHHFDDVIETIVMGMLYGGQIQTMMPKLHSLNFEGMQLIRPMYLIREEDVIHWASYNDLRFIRCACRFTEKAAACEEEENTSKRAEVKALIRRLSEINPYIEKNIFRSVENVNIDTVIAYKHHGKHHSFLEDYDEKTGREWVGEE